MRSLCEVVINNYYIIEKNENIVETIKTIIHYSKTGTHLVPTLKE